MAESGHESLTWPDAEKQRYADEYQDGWGELLDLLVGHGEVSASWLAGRVPC